MNSLVRILSDDDGTKIPKEDQVWHLYNTFWDGNRVVCSGEVFGEGEGTVTFQTRTTERGGITCKKCIKIIKWFKDKKL